MSAAVEWAAVHINLSHVLILVLLRVTSFLTSVDKFLLPTGQSRGDAMQVYVGNRIVFVDPDGAKSGWFSKYDFTVVYWQVSVFLWYWWRSEIQFVQTFVGRIRVLTCVRRL